MKRQEKGAAREQLVVEAAAAVIAERGLAHVRVADIAEHAGMSVGHVTYYFPSKAGLLIRAIQHSEERLRQQIDEAVAGIADPWQRLDRLVDLAASNGAGDAGWVLWFEAWANAGRDPELAVAQAQLDARWRAMLSSVIGYGCEAGSFFTDDAERVALLLSSLIDGLSVHTTLGDPRVSPTILRKMVADAALTHLRPPSS
jgi:AcrR family transcriptional regulator